MGPASDALEKICRQRPDLLQPSVPRLLDEGVRYPAAFRCSDIWLRYSLRSRSATPSAQAVSILRRNLATFDDWILVNLTIEALAEFARQDPTLSPDLVVLLRGYADDRRKSVAARAKKLLSEFDR